MSDLEDLDRCATKTKRKDGRVDIDCKFGLWGVSAYDEITATVEAMHYFRQYRDDGEYSSIIGGDNSTDVLMKKIATQPNNKQY